jgi:hypothetical protein
VNGFIVDCILVRCKHDIPELLRSVYFSIRTPRTPDKLNCLHNPPLRDWSNCYCGLRVHMEDENADYREDQDKAFPIHRNLDSVLLVTKIGL